MRGPICLAILLLLAIAMGTLRFSLGWASAVLDAGFLLASAGVVVLTVRELVCLVYRAMDETDED